jgi:uncharacterized damage-inducible protein DinB
VGEALALLYRHNRWANLRLLDCCAGLTDELLDAAAAGTYGTVRDTLVHLCAAEQRYAEHLLDAPNPDPWNESQGFPGFDYLRRSAEYTGAALIDVAQVVEHDEFRRGNYRGKPYELPAGVFLVQAIHHAAEHRTHVVGILSQHGVELPDLDGWTFEDEIRGLLAQKE